LGYTEKRLIKAIFIGWSCAFVGQYYTQITEVVQNLAGTMSRTERAKLGRQEIIQNIMDAAIIEFSQHGFIGASTQAIAERAGLKKSQLHYYIEDKEALYSKVLGKVLNAWADFFSFDETPGSEPAEELKKFIKMKLDYALDHPQLSRIFTMEILSGGARLEEYWPQAIAATMRKVERINRWAEEGKLRAPDGRLLIMHIWALTQYYSDYTLQAEKLMDGPLTDPEVREKILHELTTFILQGCGICCGISSPAR
tara:strand:- start:22 stop:783 length:762 start_codon:yes stop_codon:yes gene_type:complete